MIIYWKYAHNHTLCNTFNPPPVGAYSTLLRAAAVSSFLNAKKLAMHKKIVQKNTDSTCSTGLRQKEGKKTLDAVKRNNNFCLLFVNGVESNVHLYFLGRPRDKCRRFMNSASSTIQKLPKSSS